MKIEEQPPMEVRKTVRKYNLTTLYLMVMVTLIVIFEIIEVLK